MTGPHALRQRFLVEPEFGPSDRHQLGEFAEVLIPRPFGRPLWIAGFALFDRFGDRLADR